MTSVLIVGKAQLGSLETSYASAMQALGWDVHFWDPEATLRRVVPGGAFFERLIAFVPVEPWIRKANRDLVLRALALSPDLILTFPNDVVRVGALVQIKAVLDVPAVCIWPDTYVNWDTHKAACVPAYDLLATYSERTVATLQRLGASRVAWIPLAGDPHLHPATSCTPDEQPRFGADVTFIGGWRPERESVLSHLGDHDLKIWGPDWGRRCKRGSTARRAWQGRPLRGHGFATAVACSKVNLNIIDPTNYPAANMRFFEILVAGGLQVCSACPEMEAEFGHGEQLFYYKDADELPALIRSLLAKPDTMRSVAEQGRALVLEKHTYEHRVHQILEQVGLSVS
jgi:spore maturation protein CgeB